MEDSWIGFCLFFFFLSFWVFLGFDCGFEVVIGLVVFVFLGFGNLASFWPLLR